jgi:hypothetical protein
MTAILTQLREELTDPNAGPLFKYVSAIRTYRQTLREMPSGTETLHNKYDALILLSSASDQYLTHMNRKASTTGQSDLPGLTKETVKLIELVNSHPEKERLVKDALSGDSIMDEGLLQMISESLAEYTHSATY